MNFRVTFVDTKCIENSVQHTNFRLLLDYKFSVRSSALAFILNAARSITWHSNLLELELEQVAKVDGMKPICVQLHLAAFQVICYFDRSPVSFAMSPVMQLQK